MQNYNLFLVRRHINAIIFSALRFFTRNSAIFPQGGVSLVLFSASVCCARRVSVFQNFFVLTWQ